MGEFARDQLEALAAKIQHIEFGMFTSREPSGRLSSRPLTQLRTDEQGNMWFCASDQQAFTAGLDAEPSVNVSFADIHDDLYISVSGRAELSKDHKKAQQLWQPIVQAWLPGGLDDPHLVLIKVCIESAEYWDARARQMTGFLTRTGNGASGRASVA